jgi:peptidoglycan/xylan/chitin deacetylase (PgdA/CDA1 family)
VIQFHNTSGTLSYQEIGLPLASSTWQTFQAGFNVPLGVDTLTIFHLINTVGTLTTDDYSLIQTTNPNAYSKGLVSLTFDDGWQTNYSTAIPILNSAGLKSTQYIITNYIGDTADGYMTLDQIKSIYQQGHDVSAHTRTHVSLTDPTTDLQSEIAGSRTDLLGDNFSPVDSIAYPFGQYNATVQSVTKSAGFAGGRTVDLGFNDKSTNPLALTVQIVERGGVCGTDNAPATTLAQVKNWIDTAAATNTWLILVFHQTDNDPANCYGDSPSMLQSIVDYLKTSPVNVVTMSQGLRAQ